ncbi:putative O-methyltransferase YrrM [Roseivirga pacifica]|uniref:Predicted O-methyltransferase YrrM n=1 Tax=Roseivirga pacifica TaxID=1267423 RepID=A0A1I0NT39_9BACT|nr:O-methyltransferase [Roseivirga pacifica]MCO6359957.1 methyltransferase [Roseivirga pacifica]MCO6367327.1 methyltransferase [Roseivirga pacifica]MCO6370141.1 methyltransferase [Roseivirga pacifica]MCO6374984.1 methyltransferase [Roseivirga pacifica]MCO6380242.1 methyltransferase [Roseivirga pacifica]
MDFIPEDIQQYVEDHSDVESPLLSKINRETHARVMMPRMLSGHLQGRVLSMLTHMIQPKVILEVGTYTGYSALCMAEGLAEDGKLITLDINEELHDQVQGYFDESDYSAQIDYRIGNAMELIPEINEPFDLVFIDADKKNYLNYYNLVIDQVRSGGFIIADNVLWSGKVVQTEKITKDTQVILDFNRFVQEDDRVENVLFPIRDGLMIVRKK